MRLHCVRGREEREMRVEGGGREKGGDGIGWRMEIRGAEGKAERRYTRVNE